MDRNIVYPGAIPLDTDVLTVERSTMAALGYLAQATLGSATVADGLACTPTGPASMTVNVAPGSIIALTTVDATAFGSLAADTTDPLVKMGINTSTTSFNVFTAPGTSGQSINYLIQAAFQESDATPVVLPYYNAANPAVAYSGPGNTGVAQNTQRLQRVNLQVKAGSPATTGSQATPAPDSGFVGLWVVTVAYAATTIVAGNITKYASAPFVPIKLPGLVFSSLLSTAGWKRYPDANSPTGYFIEQWGFGSVTATGAGNTGTPFTLPIAYPNAHLFCMAGYAGVAPGAAFGAISGYASSLTQCQITVYTTSAVSGAGVQYISKGY